MKTQYEHASGSFEQQFQVGKEAGERSVTLIFWLFVNQGISACICTFGKGIQAGEQQAVEDEKLRESEPVAEELDHSWRKNPFSKGVVSNIVIPKGGFLAKRNKWRRTIDRPNSEGY